LAKFIRLPGGVSDTSITLSKTTDFSAVHDYIELFNTAEEELTMRWICDKAVSWPVEWDLNFTDPSNDYPLVEDKDSADFTLPYPVGFSNKLIIGLKHYSLAAESSVRFKVFPVEHPEDTLWLTYNFVIEQGDATIGITDDLGAKVPIFQLNNHQLIIKDGPVSSDLVLYNLEGKAIFSATQLTGTSAEINLSKLPSGIYLAVLKRQDGVVCATKKLYVW
jgi:hypothetical protein